MPSDADRQLAQLACTQHGLFQRSQAHAVGMTNRNLQTRVGQGGLDRLSRDVFRVSGAPDHWHQRLLAAAWACGPQCCVSHRSAGALHPFDGFRPGIVEVVQSRLRDRRGAPGVMIHFTTVLDACDRMTIGAIPVTTPIRTLIDLGAVVSRDRLEEALDGAERDGLIDRFDLIERHAEIRRSGRNGVGVLAELLATRHATAEVPQSVLERRMLRLLAAAHLPEPRCQVRVPRGDGRSAYLDLAYPDARLGIELDGHAWHSTPQQRQRDHERQNQVVLSDWTILRFTHDDVTNRQEYVVGLVRRALAATTATPTCGF